MKKLIILSALALSFLSCSDYRVDNGKVYYKYWSERDGIMTTEFQINNANSETFEELSEGFARDINNVFYKGQCIKGADSKSFVVIDRLFSKDKNRAYYAGKVIENAKGNTFKIIDSYYSSDGNDIFFETIPLNVCSVKNFRFVYNDIRQEYFDSWTTDGCFYYFRSTKIPSNDYKNVIIIEKNMPFAKDKNWVYFGPRKINFDENEKKIIDTVDVESFVVTDHIISCKDKFGYINPFHGREKGN